MHIHRLTVSRYVADFVDLSSTNAVTRTPPPTPNQKHLLLFFRQLSYTRDITRYRSRVVLAREGYIERTRINLRTFASASHFSKPAA